MSRTSLRRALTLATVAPVLAAGLLAAAPAASATHTLPPPPSCAPGTELLDFSVSGSPTTLAAQSVSSTQTNVCLRSLGLADLVVVVNSTVGLGEPSVEPGGGAFTCTVTPLFVIREPIDLTISFDVAGSTGTLCIEINGTATTLNVAALPSITTIPSFEIWRNGGTLLDTVVCWNYYLDWQLAGGAYYTSEYYEYIDCYEDTQRVL